VSRFANKLALVTGGGSGIGRAIAERLARDGAQVIVTDVTGQQDDVAAAIGNGAIGRHLDVSREEEVLALEAWIAAEFGGLDLLANNAGIASGQHITHEVTMADFDRVMGVNVRGAFMVLQAGLRLMLARGGGAIVNTASIGGFRASPNSIPYITSKGAVVMMTRTAALDYATKNIRINAIGPGTTQTAILDNASDALMRTLSERIPQERLGKASEMANVACFLLDDAETSHVTGQVWVVDGGRSAG